MPGGINGPAVLNTASNAYDRPIAYDAPVAYDTGLFANPNNKTLAQLRNDLMLRLGYSAMAANPPPGMVDLLNAFLFDAQQQLYVRYPTFRNNRWWAWQVTPGNRLYDTPISGTDFLQLRTVEACYLASNGGRIVSTWTPNTTYALGRYVMPTVGPGAFEYQVTAGGSTGPALANPEPVWPTALGGSVVCGTVTFTAVNTAVATWYPLRQGINPLAYSTVTPAIPTNFEIGRYIEIWPAPDKPYVMWLHGHLGLARFTQDNDLPTIDTHPLFLFALALAKDHYMNSGDKFASMASRMIAHLIASSHGAKRYIPRVATGGLKGAWWPGNEQTIGFPIATFR